MKLFLILAAIALVIGLVPDAIVQRVQPEGDRRTFAQCLADLLKIEEERDA